MARTSRRPKKDAKKPKYDTKSSKVATREVQEAHEEPSSDNDVAWYTTTPELVRDAASIPFSNAVGLPFSLFGMQGVLPGVAGLGISLVPGTNLEQDTPINVAARQIYSTLRSANSGARNYDSANVMMYMLALDSLYSFYHHAARMYGLLRVYAQKNRYYPKAFFDIVGWDYDDFVRNMTRFRLWLNTFVEKVGVMCVPATMTYTLRHMWLFQNLWLDGATSKAQTYFYYPTEVFEYVYTGNDKYPIALASHRWKDQTGTGAGNRLKFDELANIIDPIIGSLLAYEDLAIMSGDILKAWGPQGVWRLLNIHEDLTVLPTFSQEVMYQIHNSWPAMVPQSAPSAPQTSAPARDPFLEVTIRGKKRDCWIVDFADTVENRMYLQTCWRVALPATSKATTAGKPAMADQWRARKIRMKKAVSTSQPPTVLKYNEGTSILMDFHHEDVTPQDIMVATRLQAIPEIIVTEKASGTDVESVKLQYRTGSDMLVEFKIALFKRTPGGLIESAVVPLDDGLYHSGTLSGSGPFFTQSSVLPCLFDYFPTMYSAGYDAGTGWAWDDEPVLNAVTLYGDLQNYTVTDTQTLEKIHLAAMMAQMSVPLMGAIRGTTAKR